MGLAGSLLFLRLYRRHRRESHPNRNRMRSLEHRIPDVYFPQRDRDFARRCNKHSIAGAVHLRHFHLLRPPREPGET